MITHIVKRAQMYIVIWGGYRRQAKKWCRMVEVVRERQRNELEGFWCNILRSTFHFLYNLHINDCGYLSQINHRLHMLNSRQPTILQSATNDTSTILSLEPLFLPLNLPHPHLHNLLFPALSSSMIIYNQEESPPLNF